MVAISTIIKLVIVIIVIAILAIVLYLIFKYLIESKEREDCLNEARKICTDCQAIGAPLDQCPNTLTGDFQKCRDILDEKGDYISDCRKYIGKWK
jgi:sensor histidine kinase regulating citrate/malate metabolism